MALSFAHKALRAPHRAVADLAASLAWRPGPPQAAARQGQAGVTQGIGAQLDAAVAPALQAAPAGRALHQALGGDLAQPAAQAAAHGAAVRYAQHSAGSFGTVLPLLSVLRQRMGRGAPAGEPLCARGGSDRMAALAVPLLTLIARQFCKIDARAVVPQETLDLMNRIEPGAGDSLRRQVEQAQADIGDVHSAASLRLRQATLDALAAEVQGRAALGLAQSASAALMIGVAMVMRHSAATVGVADAAALRSALSRHAAAPGSAGWVGLAGLRADPVPLFYARRAAGPGPAPAGLRVATADASQRERQRQTLLAVQQGAQALAGVARALRRPLALMASPRPLPPRLPAPEAGVPVLPTLSDVVAGGLRRDGLADLQPTTTLHTPAARARVAEGPARRAILAMGHAVGMHAAVKPLFMASQGIGIGGYGPSAAQDPSGLACVSNP